MAHIKIGTRGSKLALKQTGMFIETLRKLDPSIDTEIVIIQAEGDWRPEKGEVRLDPARGGKGQFTTALEDRLLAGHVDLVVHSLKDVPSELPDNACLGHFLPAEDHRDVFVSLNASHPSQLPPGSRIGTASLRRQSYIKSQWPHLQVDILRGNINTRLDKLTNGQADGLILAAAGLKRLGMIDHIAHYFDIEDFTPCGGQGVIALETRENDHDLHKILDKISCKKAALRVHLERGALWALGGSCHSPIGVFAQEDATKKADKSGKKQWELFLYVGSPDGFYQYKEKYSLTIKDTADAQAQGEMIAKEFLKTISPDHIHQLGLGIYSHHTSQEARR